jgi:HK97 family phage prohead protease|tara:strand:- start:1437 stop:2057 length:621 start_codon:yes stop_codon:yes gene_type:complete
MSNTRIVTRDAFVRDTTADMLEKRQVEFVISSEAVDSYRTVFKMDGWDLSGYNRNPIVCYQHRANSDDPDNIIGTSTVRIDGEDLIGTVTFEPAEINPRAEKIFQKVQSGTLRMASVGANVQKARLGVEENGEDPDVLYFTEQRLMEWSVVSVGSNPDAHKRNSETLAEMRTSLAKDLAVVAKEIKANAKKSRTVQEAQVIINSNK